MAKTADQMKVVAPEAVWATFNRQQQQQIWQTMVAICQQMVLQPQEKEKDEGRQQTKPQNETTQ